MATVSPSFATLAPFPGDWTVADLLTHLGNVSADRVRMHPPPGYATVEDVQRIAEQEGRLYELEEGVLVAKPMVWYESLLAGLVLTEINLYLRGHDLGKVLGADGSLHILPGVVKIPDVSFIGWDRWPKEPLPRRPIPALVPHLAVEVFSETNTPAEMAHKLQRCFQAGVQLVWYIDSASRTAQSFTSPTHFTTLDEQGVLDGGAVLPGFQLSLATLFAEGDRQGPA